VTTLTKDEILRRLRANASRIHACGAGRLELFGSFARDRGGPESEAEDVVLGP
jgi:predicted nucleotidyltransferase